MLSRNIRWMSYFTIPTSLKWLTWISWAILDNSIRSRASRASWASWASWASHPISDEVSHKFSYDPSATIQARGLRRSRRFVELIQRVTYFWRLPLITWLYYIIHKYYSFISLAPCALYHVPTHQCHAAFLFDRYLCQSAPKTNRYIKPRRRRVNDLRSISRDAIPSSVLLDVR